MSARYDFAGSVALVTGAAGGMGRAVTEAFSGAGAQVVAGDIADRADFDSAAVTYVRGDISSAADTAALVATAVERFGRLDFAVNAAAIEFESVPLHECTDEQYDQMMGVNARGVFLCLKHEISAMLTGGRGGAIVNIASTNAFRPQANQPAYTASKHAVLGLTRSAAMDYAVHGIRINAICPGAIDTPMLRSAMARRGRDPQEVAGRLSRFKRFGTPAEIAAAALWLCSDASSFTTGQALGVDGGMLSS
jgi:glucose 1-dehydrogenase